MKIDVVFFSALSIIVLIAGIAAGSLLLTSSQDIRQKAYDECIPGQRSCSGNNVVICVNSIGSYQLYQACSASQKCENAACVAKVVASPTPVPTPSPTPATNPSPSPTSDGGGGDEGGGGSSGGGSGGGGATPNPTTQPRLPGDTDGDGDVDIFDLNLIITHFMTNNCSINQQGTCLIDIFDYNAVVTAFINYAR